VWRYPRASLNAYFPSSRKYTVSYVATVRLGEAQAETGGKSQRRYFDTTDTLWVREPLLL